MTIKLIFQMACILRPECNFLQGFFRCQHTCRNGRCGSQGEDDAGHLHIQEGQDITSHQVQPLEPKASSLPLHHLKDENLFRVRREAWSETQTPGPDLSTTNQATTNPAATKSTKHHPHD